jgi:hypothetical protein
MLKHKIREGGTLGVNLVPYLKKIIDSANIRMRLLVET